MALEILLYWIVHLDLSAVRTLIILRVFCLVNNGNGNIIYIEENKRILCKLKLYGHYTMNAIIPVAVIVIHNLYNQQMVRNMHYRLNTDQSNYIYFTIDIAYLSLLMLVQSRDGCFRNSYHEDIVVGRPQQYPRVKISKTFENE